MRRLACSLLGMIATVACSSPAPGPRRAPLVHEAYVWQRAWTGAIEASVADAPAELTGLRVLALELDARGAPAWPAVAADALARAGRPVIAVVRIDGSRPPAGLTLAPTLDRIAAWRRAGVDVIGVEIDHDCATAGLDAYATWLAGARPPAPLRWSITALPTWAGAPALARVAAAVDELVVQVHAIRAPALFDAGQARAWIEAFAAATKGAPLRVALPTYRVAIPQVLAADPREVAGLVRSLERRPIAAVRGIVWFRLPVATDRAAWPTATLRAVIRGEPLEAAVAVRLVARGPGRFDVVLDNPGTVAAPWPAVRIDGAIAAADLAGGYRRDDQGDAAGWSPPGREVAAGGRAVIGWVRGEELRVHAP